MGIPNFEQENDDEVTDDGPGAVSHPKVQAAPKAKRRIVAKFYVSLISPCFAGRIFSRYLILS